MNVIFVYRDLLLSKDIICLNNKLGGDPMFTANIGWLGQWIVMELCKLTVTGEILSGDLNTNEDYK